MAFSRITITFNEDLIVTDDIGFAYGFSVFSYDWVTLRSGSQEVTTGTPTATLGERAAINFTQSFIADNPSLYIVTQTTNEVQITSADELDVFSGGTSSANVTFVIDSVASIPVVPTDRINVRSPYYLHAPIYDGVGTIIPESAEFKVFIYTGNIVTDKPVDPTYTYTKQPRFLNDQNIYIDVSEQIQDFIINTYSGTLIHQSVFVYTEITTTYSGGSIIETDSLLAYDGFNLHSEGVNYIPTDELMISNRYITVPTGGTLELPFFYGRDSYTVEARNGVTVLDSDNFTAVTITDTDTTVFEIALATDNGVNNLRVVNDTQATEYIIDVEVVNECIYDPVKLTFVNRFGVKQDFWCYKVSKEELKVKDENYNSNVLESSIVANKSVLSYDATRHNKKTFNKTASKSITLNTGYIPEDNNVILEEILESEYIWLTINNVVIPVNLTTKNLPLLTKRNDQLIKYTLKFDYSYSEIQNIR